MLVNKVACTLVRAKYFSQNFSPPPLKNSCVRPCSLLPNIAGVKSQMSRSTSV